MAAPHTDTEASRLAALRALDILDTAPEALFDKLTALAAITFRAPVALVTLIDANRQWFKSCVGMEAAETSRDVAFCDHTIRQSSVMVIPDALADPRFCDNPLVTGEPYIRFYAGAPLLSADGLGLGSLCIVDYAPRAPLTAEETAQLMAMGEAVSAAMSARRDIAAYVELERRVLAADAALSFLTEHSADLILRLDQSSVISWVSPSCRAFGYEVDEVVGHFAAEFVHPEDRSRLFARRPARFATLSESDLGQNLEYRIRRKDGSWVWVQENPTLIRGPDGKASELVNVLRDITDRHRAEQAAADIQAGMLVPRPALAGLTPLAQVDAVLQSARTVGGDLYDAFMLDETHLCVLVGDVTGKGLAASLFMALSKALAHSLIAARPGDLPAAFAALGAELSRSNREAMALSLLAAVVDLSSGQVSLCNAGCEDPLVVYPDGRIEDVALEGGPPICVALDYVYRTETCALPPGASLILMTDGVTEARAPDGALFGRAGARAALAGSAPISANLDALVSAVRTFEAAPDSTDDLAIVGVRRA